MDSIKLDSRVVRHGLMVFGFSLLLGGCGLAGGGSLANGIQYQAEGKYRSAYIEAKKVLQNDDKNGKAWLLLGQASLMLGNPKDALSELQNAKANGVPEESWAVPMGRALLVTQQFDKLLKTLSLDKPFKPEVKARVAVLRGDAYLGLKQTDQARQAYEDALKSDPKDSLALVGLAKLAVITKHTDSADNYVQQALASTPDNPQTWVMQGDLAFDSKDSATAEADYQKALGFKHPDWLPQERFYALTRLADAQAQQNQFDQALASIKTLEKMSPEQPFPHYLHAVVLYRQGHLEDAISELQLVLKVSPNDMRAQFLMGAINYTQGNYSQAEMNLSNVMGVDKNNVDASRLLALTFYREGRSKQALDTLRPVVPGKPTDAELLAVLQKASVEKAGQPGASAPAKVESNPVDTGFARAGKALVSGNESEAIRLLEAIPKGNASTETRRNTLLVITYVRERRPDEALKVAAAWAAKNPRESGAHLLYGTALVVAGKRTEARAQYSEAWKLDPKNVAALLSLGSLDTVEGHYADAAGHYKTVLKTDPHNAVAMTSLGRLAMHQRDKAGAVKWFNQAIDAAPKNAPPYIALVVLYTQSGQFDEAVNTAKRLVDAVPDNPAALNALGAAQLNAGHRDEALKPLQQAVNLAPKVPLYRTNLARAQILNKDTKDAERNLDEVIKADPAQVTAVWLRAFLKSQEHDLPGAIAMAQTLQKQAATRTAGYTLEGDLYMANKSYGKAAQTYQQGLKNHYDRTLVIKRFEALSAEGNSEADGILRDWLDKNPKDGAARLLLAQYYLGQKQNTLAAVQYERVLKNYPSSTAALNNLAWIYTEQHNPKALALAERAHKLTPDAPDVADTYAWALIANKQAKTALPILIKAAKAAPKVPTIQYHLAVAQDRTGDKAGAWATLEALLKPDVKFPDRQAAEKLYRELGGAGSDTRKGASK